MFIVNLQAMLLSDICGNEATDIRRREARYNQHIDGGSYYISGVRKDQNWDAAYTHASSSGTDHTYINQDVSTTANVTFNQVTTTTKVIGSVEARTGFSTYASHGSSAYLDAAIISRSDDSWIFCDSADASNGIYHRQVGSDLVITGQQTLPGDSIAFIGAGNLVSYICLTNGNAFFKGNVICGTIDTGQA